MGGPGIHYSLKKLPIIHLIKIFAYSLKSIPLFIRILTFLSLKIKFYMPHCLFHSFLSCLSQATTMVLYSLD